jgi:hypothetical protein
MARYAVSVSVFLLALCATLSLASAQRIPDEDPVVASARLWDLDHDGTYTCDEWRQYATRLFNPTDRNHDGLNIGAACWIVLNSEPSTQYSRGTTKTVIAG